MREIRWFIQSYRSRLPGPWNKIPQKAVKLFAPDLEA